MNTQTEPALIGVAETLDLLREVVENRGSDYVYVAPESAGEDVCLYVDKAHGCPSCIVGHAAYLTGRITLEELTEWDNPDLLGDETGIGRVRQQIFSAEAVHVLAAAQLLQDLGMSWGEALKAAERRVGV